MKKFFSLLTAALFAGSMFAAEIVFSGADFTGGTANTGSAFSVTKSGVTVAANKAYGTGSELRVYATGEDDTQPSTLVVSAGTVKITKIAAEFSQYSKATFEDATPNASTWSIKPEKQLRITKLTVTIDGDAGDDEGGAIIDDGSQGGDQGGNAQNFTFNTIETYNYYDYMSEDGEDITIYMYNKANPGVYAQLDIIVPNGTGLGELPVGTYNITDTYAVNTAVVGGVDESYYPIGCWVFGEGEEDYWDLVSGTVVVAKSGDNYTITVKAEDSEGNSYVITYTGAVNIEEGEFAEEEGIENIVLTEKAQKVVVDGVVYIIRDNKLYNLQGTQVR